MILGTETSRAIDANWRDGPRAHDHVIGDFTWTGWDYLGEVGIGRISGVRPRRRPAGFTRRTRGSPPGAATSTSPDTAVRRRTTARSSSGCAPRRTSPWSARAPRPDAGVQRPWSWSDTVGSWTWPGHEGEAGRGRGLQRRRRGRAAGERPVARARRQDRAPVPAPSSRRRTSPASSSRSPGPQGARGPLPPSKVIPSFPPPSGLGPSSPLGSAPLFVTVTATASTRCGRGRCARLAHPVVRRCMASAPRLHVPSRWSTMSGTPRTPQTRWWC